MLIFNRSTEETARPVAVHIRRTSGTFTFSAIRFKAWLCGADGAPTGTALYDTGRAGASAAVDGTAAWDATNQIATWTLPTNTLATVRSVLGAFYCTAVDGLRIFPEPVSGSAQYIKIMVSKVGP
jgi:hypothetical protein